MWFKNVRLYSVELDDTLKGIFNKESLLEERLQSVSFHPTGQLELSSCGFGPVFGRNTEAFSFSHDHNHFFRFIEENKLLPSSIVNQALLDEIELKEQELNRSLKKSEKAALKTALLNKMMAQAFATRRELVIWVNSRYGFVGVSASSAKRAESALTILRKALGGSFPAKSFNPRCVVDDRLTNFLYKNDLPENFSLGNDAVLKSNDDTGATVRVSKEDLTTEEVLNHIKAKKVVTELQLNFAECVQFVITNELALKRVTLEDQYLEQNLPQKSDDKLADLQGFLIVEGDVLTNLVSQVTKVFDCD